MYISVLGLCDIGYFGESKIRVMKRHHTRAPASVRLMINDDVTVYYYV